MCSLWFNLIYDKITSWLDITKSVRLAVSENLAIKIRAANFVYFSKTLLSTSLSSRKGFCNVCNSQKMFFMIRFDLWQNHALHRYNKVHLSVWLLVKILHLKYRLQIYKFFKASISSRLKLLKGFLVKYVTLRNCSVWSKLIYG